MLRVANICLGFLVILKVLAKDKEEGCSVDGVKLKVGEHYYELADNCIDIRCVKDGVFTGKMCPTVFADPDDECEYYPQDNSKPYPLCCENYINCKSIKDEPE